MQNLRQKIEAKMNERAAANPEFKQSLLRNPRQAIENELGVAFPAKDRVSVEEDGQGKLRLALTTESRGELRDDQLEMVAGGGTGSGPYGTF